jgi:hypothetical protein
VSDDIELVEGDAVGRLDPKSHPAVTADTGPTPDERALDVDLAIGPRRKWKRPRPGVPDLLCPLCSARVPDHHRSLGQHVDWHKDLERVRAAVGLPPGHEAFELDTARLADQARKHPGAAVALGLLCMLLTAVLIVVLIVVLAG